MSPQTTLWVYVGLIKSVKLHWLLRGVRCLAPPKPFLETGHDPGLNQAIQVCQSSNVRSAISQIHSRGGGVPGGSPGKAIQAGLDGRVHSLTTARNNLICSSLSPVRKGSVLRSYACRVCRGQSLALLLKAGKKNSARWLRSLMDKAGIDTSIFKAHSTRSAAAAANAGITTSDILSSRYNYSWHSESGWLG